MNTLVPRHFSAFKGQLSKYYSFFPGYRFLDLTLGDAGHTEEALMSGCQVVSFDVDPEAIKRATDFLSDLTKPLLIEDYSTFTDEISQDEKWIIIKSNFTNALDAIEKLKLEHFDGIMVDLGPSQYQVLSEDRGFSFNSESELDMRLDKSLGVKAKDLINALNEGELRDLFELGDESYAKVIARIIVAQRQIKPITTCKQLADLVSRVKHGNKSAIHPATQVFMALRMVVNLERENISTLIPILPKLLKPDGLFGIITFHSTEDRLVKKEIAVLEEQNIVSVINKKPIVPSIEELKISPRTRSAKLRIVKKHS